MELDNYYLDIPLKEKFKIAYDKTYFSRPPNRENTLGKS